MQINHSSCRTSDDYFLLSLQQLSWGQLGTKNVSSQASAKFFEGKKIAAAESIWLKSHCVYPHKIIQTSSLGRQQKYSVEHNDCFCSIHIAMDNQKKPNRQYHYSAKLLSNKLSSYYSNAYKKHCNNSETICLSNVVLLT